MLTVDFNPLVLTRILCGVSVLIQTIELFVVRQTFDNKGVWRWDILKRDFEPFPTPIFKLLSLVMAYKPFIFILGARLIAAAFMLFVSDFYLLALLLFSNVLISMRWRGAYNGGSDAMTTLVLSALTIDALYPSSPKVFLGCVYYIAIQTCLSYFLSGISKLRSTNWRTGATLYAFLTSSIYLTPAFLLKVVQRRKPALLLAWSLICFECLFPLAIFNHNLCIALLLAGICFHICNAYLLGLNRFLFIWLSTYPVLFWCSL